MRTYASVDHEPPSATERVARFRLCFRQIPLAELEAAELVAVDGDEHEVTEGRRFEEKWNGMAGEQRPSGSRSETTRSRARLERRN